MKPEHESQLKLSLPIVLGYLETFRAIARQEKGSFEILNGKSLAEDISRYHKILSKINKELWKNNAL